MRMATVNVYLPDDLAAEVKAAEINVSRIVQEALRAQLQGARMDRWRAELRKLGPTGATSEDVTKAMAEARDELWGE